MKKLYKKLEDNNWIVAENEIKSPNYSILIADHQSTADGKEVTDGWKVYENPPAEYTTWIESQSNGILQETNRESGYYKTYYSKWLFIPSEQPTHTEYLDDGFEWHESAPQGYKTWINTL